MDSSIFTVLLPLALAFIMFGLGLTLTVADFVRVVRVPRAALIALVCQVLVLPVVCFGLVKLFELEALLAVGMMLLVASPGGTTANLFSHLAGGDVALNVTLTAVNSVLAVVTLPIVVGWSIQHFLSGDDSIGLQTSKMLQVFAIVLIPVAIGMVVRKRYPAWSERMRRPVKIGSAVVLVLVILAAVVQEFDTLQDNLGPIFLVAVLLSVCSLVIGYAVPRSLRVSRGQAIASAMEIGVHNATLAIAVAVSALDNDTIAVSPAVYGIVMFFPAAAAAYLLTRSAGHRAALPS